MPSKNAFRFHNPEINHELGAATEWFNINYSHNQNLERARLKKTDQNLSIKGLSLLNLVSEFDNRRSKEIIKQLWEEGEVRSVSSVSTLSDFSGTVLDRHENDNRTLNLVLENSTLEPDPYDAHLQNVSNYKIFYLETIYDESSEEETEIKKIDEIHGCRKENCHNALCEKKLDRKESSPSQLQTKSGSNISYSCSKDYIYNKDNFIDDFQPTNFSSSEDICISYQQPENMNDTFSVQNFSCECYETSNNLSTDTDEVDSDSASEEKKCIQTVEDKLEEEFCGYEDFFQHLELKYVPKSVGQLNETSPNAINDVTETELFKSCIEQYDPVSNVDYCQRFGGGLGYKLKRFKNKSKFPPIIEQPSTVSCQLSPIICSKQCSVQSVDKKENAFRKFLRKCKIQKHKTNSNVDRCQKVTVECTCIPTASTPSGQIQIYEKKKSDDVETEQKIVKNVNKKLNDAQMHALTELLQWISQKNSNISMPYKSEKPDRTQYVCKINERANTYVPHENKTFYDTPIDVSAVDAQWTNKKTENLNSFVPCKNKEIEFTQCMYQQSESSNISCKDEELCDAQMRTLIELTQWICQECDSSNMSIPQTADEVRGAQMGVLTKLTKWISQKCENCNTSVPEKDEQFDDTQMRVLTQCITQKRESERKPQQCMCKVNENTISALCKPQKLNDVQMHNLNALPKCMCIKPETVNVSTSQEITQSNDTDHKKASICICTESSQCGFKLIENSSASTSTESINLKRINPTKTKKPRTRNSIELIRWKYPKPKMTDRQISTESIESKYAKASTCTSTESMLSSSKKHLRAPIARLIGSIQCKCKHRKNENTTRSYKYNKRKNTSPCNSTEPTRIGYNKLNNQLQDKQKKPKTTKTCKCKKQKSLKISSSSEVKSTIQFSEEKRSVQVSCSNLLSPLKSKETESDTPAYVLNCNCKNMNTSDKQKKLISREVDCSKSVIKKCSAQISCSILPSKCNTVNSLEDKGITCRPLEEIKLLISKEANCTEPAIKKRSTQISCSNLSPTVHSRKKVNPSKSTNHFSCRCNRVERNVNDTEGAIKKLFAEMNTRNLQSVLQSKHNENNTIKPNNLSCKCIKKADDKVHNHKTVEEQTKLISTNSNDTESTVEKLATQSNISSITSTLNSKENINSKTKTSSLYNKFKRAKKSNVNKTKPTDEEISYSSNRSVPHTTFTNVDKTNYSAEPKSILVTPDREKKVNVQNLHTNDKVTEQKKLITREDESTGSVIEKRFAQILQPKLKENVTSTKDKEITCRPVEEMKLFISQEVNCTEPPVEKRSTQISCSSLLPTLPYKESVNKTNNLNCKCNRLRNAVEEQKFTSQNINDTEWAIKKLSALMNSLNLQSELQSKQNEDSKTKPNNLSCKCNCVKKTISQQTQSISTNVNATDKKYSAQSNISNILGTINYEECINSKTKTSSLFSKSKQANTTNGDNKESIEEKISCPINSSELVSRTISTNVDETIYSVEPTTNIEPKHLSVTPDRKKEVGVQTNTSDKSSVSTDNSITTTNPTTITESLNKENTVSNTSLHDSDTKCQDCFELRNGINNFLQVLGGIINKEDYEFEVPTIENRCKCCKAFEEFTSTNESESELTSKTDTLENFRGKLIDNLLNELYSKHDSVYDKLDNRIKHLNKALKNTMIKPYLSFLKNQQQLQQEEEKKKTKGRHHRRNKLSLCQIQHMEMTNGLHKRNIINVCDVSNMYRSRVNHRRPVYTNQLRYETDQNYYYNAFLPIKTNTMSKTYPATCTHEQPNYYYAQISTSSNPPSCETCNPITYTKQRKTLVSPPQIMHTGVSNFSNLCPNSLCSFCRQRENTSTSRSNTSRVFPE